MTHFTQQALLAKSWQVGSISTAACEVAHAFSPLPKCWTFNVCACQRLLRLLPWTARLCVRLSAAAGLLQEPRHCIFFRECGGLEAVSKLVSQMPSLWMKYTYYMGHTRAKPPCICATHGTQCAAQTVCVKVVPHCALCSHLQVIKPPVAGSRLSASLLTQAGLEVLNAACDSDTAFEQLPDQALGATLDIIARGAAELAPAEPRRKSDGERVLLAALRLAYSASMCSASRSRLGAQLAQPVQGSSRILGLWGVCYSKTEADIAASSTESARELKVSCVCGLAFKAFGLVAHSVVLMRSVATCNSYSLAHKLLPFVCPAGNCHVPAEQLHAAAGLAQCRAATAAAGGGAVLGRPCAAVGLLSSQPC